MLGPLGDIVGPEVDYLYTKVGDGSGEETKHLAHVFAKDLRVRGRCGWLFPLLLELSVGQWFCQLK